MATYNYKTTHTQGVVSNEYWYLSSDLSRSLLISRKIPMLLNPHPSPCPDLTTLTVPYRLIEGRLHSTLACDFARSLQSLQS
jgi:hypothetical protein